MRHMLIAAAAVVAFLIFPPVASAERICGTNRDDSSLQGGNGKDRILGLAGKDWLGGGRGNDVLYGNQNSDQVWGHAGDDRLFGDGDSWSLVCGFAFGNAGNDLLDGGSGNDWIVGGAGNDVIRSKDFEVDVI